MGIHDTILDPGAGGDHYEAWQPTDQPDPPGPQSLRQIIRLAGANVAELASILSSLPTLADYGLVVRVAGNRAESAAVTSVAGVNVVAAVLLASSAGRIGASIYNDSGSSLYIKSGAGATTSNFSVKVLPGGYWEAPAGYTGELSGIWDSATGAARVTEYT